MQVWELMAALAKCPAGAEVLTRQGSDDENTPIDDIETERAVDENYVVIIGLADAGC